MVYPPNASPSSHHLFCFWPTHSVTISSSPHSSPSLEIQNGGLIFCKGHTEHVTTVLIKISLHCCRLSIPFYMASVLIKPNWIGAFKQDPFCTKSIFFLFMILYQCFSIIFSICSQWLLILFICIWTFRGVGYFLMKGIKLVQLIFIDILQVFFWYIATKVISLLLLSLQQIRINLTRAKWH